MPKNTAVKTPPVSDIAPEVPATPVAAQGKEAPVRAREDDIRARAYARYLARGDEAGSAEDDWFAAERDLGYGDPEGR
jgi:hypothetical protein